jgi:hypothetical protein
LRNDNATISTAQNGCFTSPSLSESLLALTRYCVRYAYVTLYCRVFRSRKYGVQGLWRLNAVHPEALLSGFQADLRTLLFRMGKRCSTLPEVYSGAVLPVVEASSRECPVPNMHSLACIHDIRSFATSFPLATRFDWDAFQEGWSRGYQCRDRVGTEGNGMKLLLPHASVHYQPTTARRGSEDARIF